RHGIAAGARAVSNGGIAVAISKMALGATRPIGVWLHDCSLPFFGIQAQEGLLTEGPMFVLEVSDAEAAYALADAHGIGPSGEVQSVHVIGSTIDSPAIEFGACEPGPQNDIVLLADLRDAWEAPLRDFYGSVA
ncbi:MAG TPA: hypothetical protein VGT98_09495, partial [Candidatus Elarobacter sp.]|nr:hypothetical protein [Candidatus Elarobacter sp.]